MNYSPTRDDSPLGGRLAKRVRVNQSPKRSEFGLIKVIHFRKIQPATIYNQPFAEWVSDDGKQRVFNSSTSPREVSEDVTIRKNIRIVKCKRQATTMSSYTPTDTTIDHIAEQRSEQRTINFVQGKRRKRHGSDRLANRLLGRKVKPPG